MSNSPKFHSVEKSMYGMSFGDDVGPTSTKADTGYAVVGRFIFCGTLALGFTPTVGKAIAYLTAGSNGGSVRVYDETNTQTVLEITDITDVSPTIQSDALSNLPVAAAMFKVEIQGGSSSTLGIEHLCFCK